MDDDDYNVFSNDVDEPQEYLQDEQTVNRRQREQDVVDFLQIGSKSPFHDAEFAFTSRHSSKENSSDPIDWHMRVQCSFDEQAAKRRKFESDQRCLDQLTEQIAQIRHRKAAQLVDHDHSVTRKENDDCTVPRTVPIPSKFPPNDGSEWLPISSIGGDRRFYLIIDRNVERLSKKPDCRVSAGDFGQIMTEALNLLATPSTLSLPELPFIDESAQLWVEKYRPKVYTDLLSDDGTNRTLLTWLKLWDMCVFAKKYTKPVIVKQKTAKSIKMSKFKLTDIDDLLTTDSDRYKRPTFKVWI